MANDPSVGSSPRHSQRAPANSTFSTSNPRTTVRASVALPRKKCIDFKLLPQWMRWSVEELVKTIPNPSTKPHICKKVKVIDWEKWVCDLIVCDNWIKHWLACVELMSNGRKEEDMSEISDKKLLVKQIVRCVVAEIVSRLRNVKLDHICLLTRRLINATAIRQNESPETKLRLYHIVNVVLARFDFDVAKKAHSPDFVMLLQRHIDFAFSVLKTSATSYQARDCVDKVTKITAALNRFCERSALVRWHVVLPLPRSVPYEIDSAARNFIIGLPLPNLAFVDSVPAQMHTYIDVVDKWLVELIHDQNASRWTTLEDIITEECARRPAIDVHETLAHIAEVIICALLVAATAKVNATPNHDAIAKVADSQSRRPVSTSSVLVFRDLLDLALGMDNDRHIQERRSVAMSRTPLTPQSLDIASEIFQLGIRTEPEATDNNNVTVKDDDDLWRIC